MNPFDTCLANSPIAIACQTDVLIPGSLGMLLSPDANVKRPFSTSDLGPNLSHLGRIAILSLLHRPCVLSLFVRPSLIVQTASSETDDIYLLRLDHDADKTETRFEALMRLLATSLLLRRNSGIFLSARRLIRCRIIPRNPNHPSRKGAGRKRRRSSLRAPRWRRGAGRQDLRAWAAQSTAEQPRNSIRNTIPRQIAGATALPSRTQ